MSKSRRRGDIPVQMQDMGPEFAGFQFQAATNDCCNGFKKSRKYNIFRDTLLKMVYTNYIWYGLEEKESSAIENALINDGRVIAVKSDFNMSEMTPDGVFYGRYVSHPTVTDVDFYGWPIAAGVMGLNGKNINVVGQDKFVVGFSSSAHNRIYCMTHPIYTYIERLAMEMDDAYSAWKVAVETRKCGMVFQVPTKRTANFLQKILSDISDNNPHIVITGELEGETQVVLNNVGGDQITQFHDNFMNCVSFAMDMLGIENSPSNKKERLVVSEAEMSRSLSRYIGADGLKARRAFADECNKKLGSNIRVENYLASVIDEMMDDATKEGVQTKDNNDKGSDRVE